MFKTIFTGICVAVAFVAYVSGPSAAISFARNIGIVSGTTAGSATVKAQAIVASAAGNGGHLKVGNPLTGAQKKAVDAAKAKVNRAAGCVVRIGSVCSLDAANQAKRAVNDANNVLGGAAGHDIAGAIKQGPKLIQGTPPLVAIRGGGHGVNLTDPNSPNLIGGGGDFNTSLGGGGDFTSTPSPAPTTPAPLPTTSQFQLPSFGH